MKKADVSCADCYFRRAGLCALPGNVPCPTFRPYRREGLMPPQQARLVMRTLAVTARSA